MSVSEGSRVEEDQHRVAWDPVQNGVAEIRGNYNKEEKEKEEEEKK